MTFSPHLPFCTGGDNHRHLQKKKKCKQSFGSSSLFLDLLFSGFSLSLGSFFFSSASDRSGSWVAAGLTSSYCFGRYC